MEEDKKQEYEHRIEELEKEVNDLKSFVKANVVKKKPLSKIQTFIIIFVMFTISINAASYLVTGKITIGKDIIALLDKNIADNCITALLLFIFTFILMTVIQSLFIFPKGTPPFGKPFRKRPFQK